jgi:hypothetical protein
VRAEHLPQPLVAALGDEVQVELAERRQEAVRVVALPVVPVGKPEAQPIGEGRLGVRREGRPHAAADRLHGDRGLAVGQEIDAGGIGVEGAHHAAAGDGVRAEDRVRVVVLAAGEALGLGGGN